MSQVNRRQALKLFAALGATGVTAACADDQPTDESAPPRSDVPVKIGLLIPQTGGFKSIGEDLVRGFQLFVDLNDGRLGGHPVRIETADEGSTAAAGVAGLKQLLDSGVAAVTGVVSSTVIMALRDTIRQARVPLIGSVASPTALQGEVYVWRTSYVDSDPATAIGPYVEANTTGKVVMVAPSFAASQEVVAGFRDGFGWLESRLTKEPIFAGDDADPRPGYYEPAIKALKSANPGAVFCDFAGAAAIEFIREYRAAGLRGKLFGTGFLTEGPIVAELQEDAAGIMTAMNYSADLPNAANRLFASEYRRRHNISPTTYAMSSYDAAQVLDNAVSLAGKTPDPQQINLALGKVGRVDSPRGTWQFNQSRTPQQKWYLREVRADGRVLSNVLISELSTLG